MQDMQQSHLASEQDPDAAGGGVTAAVEQKAQQVQEKAGELRSEASGRLRKEVDTRSSQLGEQAKTAGEALRRASTSAREGGSDSIAQLFENAAGRVDNASRYFTETSGDRLLGDVEEFARRRPWAVGGVAILVGFIASRVLKASSTRRYAALRDPEAGGSAASTRGPVGTTAPPPAIPPPAFEPQAAVGAPVGDVGV